MSMLYRYFPGVAVMGAIFYFSSRTGDDLGSLLPLFQKLFPQMEGFNWGHFIAYFVLALTYVWALAGERPKVRHMVLVVLLCLLYGLTDEYHQTFVPGRAADWHDLRNDGIGASLAMLSLRLPWTGSLYARLPHRVKRM